jgi:uncharacterized protein DUF1559
MLLPFLDEASLYNACNFDIEVQYQTASARGYANNTVRVQKLNQVMCPSLPELNSAVGVSDYAGNTGYSWACRMAAPGCPKSSSGATCNLNVVGLMPNGRSMRIRDVRDGSSQTFAAGERNHEHVWAFYNVPSGMSSSNSHGWWQGFGTFALTWYRINTTSTNVRWAFAGGHEGGGFFLFADGAVRFLSENIDFTTYRSLSTIARNELIDDEDY